MEESKHNMDGENINNNSRRPRNLQGLLRFAMEATKAEDAPSDFNFSRLDPERRQFLENALKSLTIDVIEELQKAAEIIGSETTDQESKENAMDTILNYIDDVDTAVDFCKIGGLFILLPCLSSPYSTIRKKSAQLVAELSQNNPFCQKQLLEADVLPKLIELLSENETAVDGIHAISCFVRSYEPCLKAFTEIGGLECIIGCLQTHQQEKLVTKAAFLLNSLCADFPAIREEFIKLKAIETILPLIQPSNDYNVCLETLLSSLCCLTADYPEAIARCRTEDINLANTLNTIVELGKGKDECKEIVEYSQNLLKNIFGFRQDVEITDR